MNLLAYMRRIIFLIVNLQISVLNNPISESFNSPLLQPRQMGIKAGGGGGVGCKDYLMVGARGTSERQGGGSMAYNDLVKNVMGKVANGSKYEVVYSSSAEYMTSPKQGAQSGLKHVKSVMSSCPKTVFVLMGYSKGAMVVTQMLLDKSLTPSKVPAIVLFGNPYFSSGASQNLCEMKTGKGIAAMMGVKMPASHAPNTFDCCARGDSICQTAGSMMSHLGYAKKGAPQATEFVIRKLKSKGSAGTGSGGGNDSGGFDSGSSKNGGKLGGGGLGRGGLGGGLGGGGLGGGGLGGGIGGSGGTTGGSGGKMGSLGGGGLSKLTGKMGSLGGAA